MMSDSLLRWLFRIPILLATLYYLAPLAVHPGDLGLWALLVLPAALGLAVLPLRHSRPVVVSVIVSACLAISPAAIGAVLGVVGSLARRNGVGRGVIGPAGLVLAGVLVKAVHLASTAWNSAAWVELVISGGMLLGALLVGLLIHALSDSSQSRAQAEEYRATQIRMAERARIAREMHDVVAHRVSLVAMMSGALAYREDLPADARDAVKIIQDNSRQALEELRVVLADLRRSEDPEAPQPTLAELPGLLDEAREAGTTIDLQLGLASDTVPERHSRHLYRMIQEGLTNARRHAPGADVTICLAGNPSDGITLHMSNPAASSEENGGYGLVGIDERARLLGGVARTRWEDGRFTLEVSVPWKVG
ncbi:MAG: histidine kinase [Corynebacterium sp.]|uniref:sensor histidine kinase n=1 Tax=Corynebacterium sp. TaxID=1720 RepID=UPI0026DF59D4|nr:histidine kinase [Corynebacterium sp.]MDO5669793.1 histidine kinase [Corynebacterium sp.]